ncbi:Cdc6/Cdc18 family protein [Salinarchaeum laminariae]|uniref:Cdc6/Cdc18 family protein n=1 Tax=Salinarchaeum laminariae TaxID=869888 RepID=UPI0020BDDD33|nr:Cdc6/Cdc18 family protein [Salinarchaeum laminariae]
MIEDARFLREGFVPHEVVHRDPEVEHLSGVLDPVTRGEPAETALLTGPSGVGKTCIAKFTTDRLREERLDIETLYVNCWQNYSAYRTLYRILEGLGGNLDIHRQSTPRDELIERLRNYTGEHCVLVLDEVDQLQGKRILYDLHEFSQFSMVLIANSENELFADTDARLTSRLRGSERVHFDRYGLDALVAIMAQRVDKGLAPDTIDPSFLETIADEAAGDARFALSILRSAAQAADRDGADAITDERIMNAIPQAREAVRQKSLETLTPHQRAIYDIIEEAGTIEPPDLYDAYRDRVDDAKTDRTVRNYLSKMEQYNLIDAEGTSRDRIYQLARAQ